MGKKYRLSAVKEAPVYHPTEDEFADPLRYIASIRAEAEEFGICLLYTSPSPRDRTRSRMPSSA